MVERARKLLILMLLFAPVGTEFNNYSYGCVTSSFILSIYFV